MTSSQTELTAFTHLLQSGQVRHNRRDLLRVSAVVAAAASMPAGGIVARQSTADSSPAAGAAAFTLHLPFNPYGQPVSIDPHRTVNWGPFWVMLPYAWSGLLRFDQNGAVEADLAESVTSNDDGTVYTAILREGIAFADGTPITPDHVIASWMRALDSSTLSPMSRFMEPIVGAVEIAAGDNVPLGVVAKDERTLEITLSAPLAHFPSYLATFGYALVHPEIDNLATPLPPGDACSGPWKITSSSEQEIVMVPNAHHWSDTSADVAEIVWHIAPSGNTDQSILEWYQNNEVAIADAPIGLLASIQADTTLAGELVAVNNQAATMVLMLDFHQAPFNDVRVRRAVAAAIDRQVWADEIQMGTYLPANSFTPPVLATIAGYTAPTDAFDEDPRTLLADAGIDMEASEAEAIFFQPATDSTEAMERSAALIEMITAATGLQITHDTLLTAEQITAARQDAGGLQMAMLQWQLDSDQPSLLALFAQESAYNSGWVNWEPGLENAGDFTPGADAVAFHELVSSAATLMDAEQRNAAYTEAEVLLLKNAVVIPLGYWTPHYLQKPWLTGTKQGPWSGSTPVRIDSEVVIDRLQMPATPQSSPEA